MNATIDTLARLVAFPTVSDRPVVELAAWLASRAEDAGFRVERFETSPGKVNVVASAGPPGTEGLVLSGHMDVVPTDGQDWSSDPFRLVEREGRLYGRGSCDMKGFLAATTEAVADLSVAGLKRELVLVWTHDEEVGCMGSAALVHQIGARPLPTLAIIGEPTSFHICRMHPGHFTMEVVCTGRAAHSSRPELGASAIRVARLALNALEELEEQLRQERAFEAELSHPYPIVNVGMIHGGTAVNIVPDRCAIRVGVRPLPGQSAESVLARFAAALDAVNASVSAWGGAVSIAPLHLAPALLTERGTALETLLVPHAASPEPGAVPFATDGGNLARMGVRSLVFGPGSIDVAHRPDEYIEAVDLLRATSILRDVVRQRCLGA